VIEMLSYGAGVNSTALAILMVNRGWRGEIVFSDTGAEWPETYCHLDYFEQQWLKPRGLSVTVLRGLPWQRKGQGWSLIDYCEARSMIPLAAMRWCTVGWKSEPLERYRLHIGADRVAIGIAADEGHRQKGHWCPLVDEGIDRKGCIRIIQAEGLDVPRKSGCWLCPFQRRSQWRELWQQHPDLFERAARLEEAVAEKRDKNCTFDPDGKRTLRDLERGFRAQLPMLDDEVMADLVEYKPCVCGL